MLLQFRIKNYRSFRDETVLDMSASNFAEHSDTLIHFDDEKILPVTAIFGANASGKTNIVSAYMVMAFMVQHSLEWYDETDGEGNILSHVVLPEYYPFAFDPETKDKDIEFEVWFTSKYDKEEITFNYGFSWDKNRIHEEWLNKKNKQAEEYSPVYLRKEKELTIYSEDIPESGNEIIRDALSPQMLVVSLGARLNFKILQSVYRFFQPTQVLYPKSGVDIRVPYMFKTDKKVQQQVLRYLQAFDDSIVGFEIDESIHSANEFKNIFTLHKSVGNKTPSRIPLEEESTGTLRMFSLYRNLFAAINNGSVLWMDEINSHLHPLLVRNLILNFIDPRLNPLHAQLIFTTHDPWMLENSLLRKDEIWFVEKNTEGISDLYSLADFRDVSGNSNEKSYAKRYLFGEFGAIPELNSLVLYPEYNHGS